MQRRVCVSLLCLLWVSAPMAGQAAPDGTPERAIQDMLLASDPLEVEAHLPLSTVEAIKTLDPADRQELEGTLIWRKRAPEVDVQVPEDGHAFLVFEYSPENKTEAQLENSLITGSEAVLRFTQGEAAGRSQRVLAWMRYEDGEWRVWEVDLGGWRDFRFDDPEFVERFRHSHQKDNESSASSALYTINYSLQSFAQARPDIGFPDDLATLASLPDNTDDSDSDQPTGFLSADLAHNDFVRDGYSFHYQLIHGGPQGTYSIGARPTDQKAGRFSYFIDESGGVRQTSEDRDATAEDPPLGSQ